MQKNVKIKQNFLKMFIQEMVGRFMDWDRVERESKEFSAVEVDSEDPAFILYINCSARQILYNLCLFNLLLTLSNNYKSLYIN
mgnify:CR=1 FL=1